MSRVETFNREDVLHQAMQVFWDKGFNATSMQDLVDATGLNRSSIYNSFGDKMSLYRESLSTYMRETQAQFNDVLKKAENPLQAIHLIFESFLPEISEDSRGCMSMNCKAEMSHDVNIKNWLEHTQEATLSLFQKLVKDGQEQGFINKNKSYSSYAWHIMSSFQGFRMTGILEKDEELLRDIIDNSLSILKAD